MKKKRIVTLLMTLTMVFNASTAFALPSNTVIVGEEGYSLDYFFATDLIQEIKDKITIPGKNLFVDAGSGFKDAWTGADMTQAQKDAMKDIKYLASDGSRKVYKTFEEDTTSPWTLVWSDEFDGTEIDKTKWTHDIGNWIVDGDGNGVAAGWGNNEKQYYTDSPKNSYVEDGRLIITAKEEKNSDKFGEYDYSSALLSTRGLFSKKYGKFEIKAKLPVGKGYWPAVWMMPENDVYGGWAASGEIDIMEAWGSKPNQVAGTLHHGGMWPSNRYTGKDYHFPEGETVEDYHVYSLEWEPGEIRWYVDGELYQTQNNWRTTGIDNEESYAFPAPFDQEFHLILNLAVGGWFDGDPTEETQFPQSMEIDYVRVYELTGRPYMTPVTPEVEGEPLPEGAKQADETGNLVSDTNFEQGIKVNPEGIDSEFGTGWNLIHNAGTGGVATATVEAINGVNFAKVDVINQGSQSYAVQLEQHTTLGKGRWYEFSFDAKADKNRTLNTKLGGGPDAGWAGYSESYTLNLTPEVQSFKRQFQMGHDSDIKTRIEFNCATATGPVWIGNVRLVEIDPPQIDHDGSKAPLENSGNHIYNGSFDKYTIDRMGYWAFNVDGASASAKVPEDTRELVVSINDGGTRPEAITLNQKGISLSEKNEYKLTFKARANAPRTIEVGIMSKDGAVKYLDHQTISLTTTMTEQEINFGMSEGVTDPESQIVFRFGGDNNDVYLDDISLMATSSFIDYDSIDIFPLKNGDFSNGLQSWSSYPNIGDGGNSVITEENGEAKISVVEPGPNAYSIMLNQENFNITKGIEYVLAFDVRSTADRTVEVVIDNSSYDRYFSEVVSASRGFKRYEYVVKPKKDDTVSLKFLLGKTDQAVPTMQHDIFIDNVVCEVKDAPAKKSPVLVANKTNNKLTHSIDITYGDDLAWRESITAIKINDRVLTADQYKILEGRITFAPDNFETIGDYNIVVMANGYANASCVQNMKDNNDLIITNGTFDTDTAGWKVEKSDGSDAAVSVEDGEMKVHFANYAGWLTWSTQVYQNTIELVAGKTYELKFDARSTQDRQAWLEMTGLAKEELALTTTKQTFTYVFTAEETISNGKLNFLLGTENLVGELFKKDQSVYLDNISITETDQTVEPIEPTEPVEPIEPTEPVEPTEPSIIINGDFSSGEIAPWGSWTDGGLGVSVVNGEAEIAINGFGGDPWSVQFFQEGVEFEPNAKYTLIFKARSSVARSFGLSIEGAGFFRHLDKLDHLTTDMQTYTYDFIVTKDEPTKLVFLLGKTGEEIDSSQPYTIYIDDVLTIKK